MEHDPAMKMKELLTLKRGMDIRNFLNESGMKHYLFHDFISCKTLVKSHL